MFSNCNYCGKQIMKDHKECKKIIDKNIKFLKGIIIEVIRSRNEDLIDMDTYINISKAIERQIEKNKRYKITKELEGTIINEMKDKIILI